MYIFKIFVVLLSLVLISAMKHVFYVDVRHLPYQTFINILFNLMLHNILVFKENKHVQKCYFSYQIRIKSLEYNFEMQRFSL